MEDIDPKAFLEELQKEKKIIEKYIKQLEDSIIDNETKYLLSTVNNGNILRGWEYIFTSKSNKINIGTQVKKTHISNNEKLFSQTFDFEKYQDENNKEGKYLSSNNLNHNLRIEENKNISSNNLNTNVEGGNLNHNGVNKKHKKSVKNFVGLKRSRNNSNLKANDNENKDEKKNS